MASAAVAPAAAAAPAAEPVRIDAEVRFVRLLCACERLAYGTSDRAVTSPSAAVGPATATASTTRLPLEAREYVLPAESFAKFAEVRGHGYSSLAGMGRVFAIS